MLGVAVQVQAVVPVRASDQRQAVRSFVCCDKIKAAFQMSHQGNSSIPVIVKRYLLIQDRGIAGLADISGDCGDQPQRVIVETASDIGVPFFGQRLILMVSAAVLELCGSDIDDSCTRTLRNQVNEAKQILAGITESHAAADAGFVVGSGAGHIEGNHTLILDTLIYITDQKLYSLQYLLYTYINQASSLAAMVKNNAGTAMNMAAIATQQTPTSIRMTVSVIVVLPILFVYPMFQRFFVKGIMIGSVKG